MPKKRKKEPANRSDGLGAVGGEGGHGEGGRVADGSWWKALCVLRAQTSSAVEASALRAWGGVTAEGEAEAGRAGVG